MGTRYGCAHDSPRHGDPVLEKLWKSDRRRRAGFSHHPLVPERIHWRSTPIPDQGASSTILPTLGRTDSPFLHHVGHSDPARAGGTLLFIAVPSSFQHITWVVVDQRASLRNHGSHIVDSCVSRDVYRRSAARRGFVVDWMARQDFRLIYDYTLHSLNFCFRFRSRCCPYCFFFYKAF